MKKVLILMLALTLSLGILASCGCSEHIDTDKNGKCDNCSAEVEVNCNGEHTDDDKDNICDYCKEVLIKAPVEKDVTLTLTLVDQDNLPLVGTKLSVLKSGSETPVAEATTDSDGKLTVTVKTGSYALDYTHADELYYQAQINTLTVAESTTAVTLTFRNNTPNGSVDRPYPLSVDTNEAIIDGGATSYFIVYRAVDLIVDIAGTDLKVAYGDAEYTSDVNGNIHFELLGEDTNSAETFSVTNLGAEAANVSITVNSKPGTQGNPLQLDSIGESITVSGVVNKASTYYEYTATAAGTLVLTLLSENSYANMYNTNSYVVVNTSEGATVSLTVAVGDRILIDCNPTVDEATDVVFSIDYVEQGADA